ncbi:hypothetical protein H9P43_001249 [Blastocladiella emersonii ATCC 22665]|nr:hypothetical protein H9P43_001249 [Blastocladiella emersonii ATCC 22665]
MLRLLVCDSRLKLFRHNLTSLPSLERTDSAAALAPGPPLSVAGLMLERSPSPSTGPDAPAPASPTVAADVQDAIDALMALRSAAV